MRLIRFALVGFTSVMLAGCFLPIYAPDSDFSEQKGELSHKGSSIVRDFSVWQQHNSNISFNIIVNFHVKNISDASSETLRSQAFSRLREVVGDFDHKLYDPKEHRYLTCEDVSDQAACWRKWYGLLKNGQAIMVYVHPGIVLPVHLKIEKLDGAESTAKIMDQTFITAGAFSYGSTNRTRDITSVNLLPGKYRLTAEAVQDVALPQDIETSIDLYVRHK